MILKLLVDSGARKCKRVAPYGLKPSYYNQKFETGCDGHLCSPIKPKDLRKPKTWDKSLACWITGNDVKKQKNWTALQIWWKDKKETDQRGSRNADSNIKWLPLESIQSPCLHMHMCVCVYVKCKKCTLYLHWLQSLLTLWHKRCVLTDRPRGEVSHDRWWLCWQDNPE